MSIETGLVTHLTADDGVSALIGARMYPLVSPQDAALPVLVYQKISGKPDYTHAGASGLARARFQFTCQAASYARAKALAAAVRASLSGFSGTMDATAVGAVFVENDRDGWSEAFKAPVVRVDVMIWYQE